MRIVSVRHRGLKSLVETGEARGMRRELVKRVRNALTALGAAKSIDEVATTPGLRLHKLSGRREGTWSLAVSGNWRLTFTLADGEIHDLDLEDYH